MIKNSPFNAENMALIPGQGTNIPHAMGQLIHALQLKKSVCCSEDPVQQKNFLMQFKKLYYNIVQIAPKYIEN